MIVAYLLIFTPIILFVLAFLYETFLAFRRLKKHQAGQSGYVDATWEVTNTLLVAGVVMLIMLFTKSLTAIASAIFTSTLLAGGALLVRAICYVYIFYVRTARYTNWVDWLFAFSHVVAAGLLVITVVKATWLLFTKHPEANLQFIPIYLPGMILTLLLCAIPLAQLYRTK